MTVMRHYVRDIASGLAVFVIFELVLIFRWGGGVGVDLERFFSLAIHSPVWWVQTALAFVAGFLLSISFPGSVRRRI